MVCDCGTPWTFLLPFLQVTIAWKEVTVIDVEDNTAPRKCSIYWDIWLGKSTVIDLEVNPAPSTYSM